MNTHLGPRARATPARLVSRPVPTPPRRTASPAPRTQRALPGATRPTRARALRVANSRRGFRSRTEVGDGAGGPGGEAKDSAFLSSRDTDLLEPTEWTQGFRASSSVWREDSGLLSRPCRKRRPSSRDDGGVSWVFSRGTTRISGSLSCGAREVRSPCAWRGGARPGSRVTGGD